MSDAEAGSARRWQRGAVMAGAASGFGAGIAMGVVLHLGTDLLPVLGAFAGRTTVLRGWLVHIVLSVLYGVVFAVLIAFPAIERFLAPEGTYEYAFAGLIYAAMVMGAGAAGTIAVLPFVLELPWVSTTGSAVQGPALGGARSGARVRSRPPRLRGRPRFPLRDPPRDQRVGPTGRPLTAHSASRRRFQAGVTSVRRPPSAD